jgi:hypothetical protein
MVTCNLNDWVKFKLNKRGKMLLEEYLKSQRNKLGVDASCLYKVDSEGFIKIQLHDFMRVFGPMIGIDFNGSPIEGNELIFCGDE